MSDNNRNDNLFFDSITAEEFPQVDTLQFEKAQVLPENSVMLQLEIGGISFEKKVATAEVSDKEGIDKSLISTTKKLIDKKYLDPISRLDGRMRQTLYDIGLRPAFLKNGSVLVTINMLAYTVRKIEDYKRERQLLINDLLAVYEQAKLDAQTRSPALYREEDYPSVAELSERFAVRYNLFPVAFPDIIERLEAELVQEADAEVRRSIRLARQEKMRELEEATDEIKLGLRSGFLDLVANLEDKVRGVGTERKVFKPGFVNGFRTFLETFDAKNIMNDDQLKELVDRARVVLDGVSPDSIRNNMEVRVRLEQELAGIKTALAGMVETPGRAASFA